MSGGRVGSEAEFKNDAAAFLSIHSGHRMNDEILSATAAGRREPLETGRDGRFLMFDDFKAFRHDTEGSLLAQSQVCGVVTQVIGVSFNQNGIDMFLERSAHEQGIARHHVGEKPVCLCGQGAFPEVKVKQILGDNDAHQQRIRGVFVHREAELGEVLMEQGLDAGRGRFCFDGAGGRRGCRCVCGGLMVGLRCQCGSEQQDENNRERGHKVHEPSGRRLGMRRSGVNGIEAHGGMF